MTRKPREKSLYTGFLEHLYQTTLSLGRLTVYFGQREAIATTLVIASRVREAQTVVPALEINFLYLQRMSFQIFLLVDGHFTNWTGDSY